MQRTWTKFGLQEDETGAVWHDTPHGDLIAYFVGERSDGERFCHAVRATKHGSRGEAVKEVEPMVAEFLNCDCTAKTVCDDHRKLRAEWLKRFGEGK